MKKALAFACLTAVVLCGCSKGKTIATIGSEKITSETVQKRINETPPVYRNFLSTPAGKKQFIDLLVRERAVIESAKKSGFENRKEYKDAINQFEQDQVRKLKEYKESLLMETYLQDLRSSDLKVTGEEIDKYYDGHIADYQHPTEVVARHILVPTKEEADKALARVNSGEDFAKVAAEMSTDSVSAKRGGEIGPFHKGDLLPEFEAAVFPLKNGQVSEVVKTQFGYHVIKKVSEKSLPAINPEQAKEGISRLLEKEKFDKWLEATKNKYGVHIDYDAMNAVAVAQEAPMAANPENIAQPQAQPQQQTAPAKIKKTK
jgi:parvulin-like peptidyl-prolyl isomerase